MASNHLGRKSQKRYFLAIPSFYSVFPHFGFVVAATGFLDYPLIICYLVTTDGHINQNSSEISRLIIIKHTKGLIYYKINHHLHLYHYAM